MPTVEPLAGLLTTLDPKSRPQLVDHEPLSLSSRSISRDRAT